MADITVAATIGQPMLSPPDEPPVKLEPSDFDVPLPALAQLLRSDFQNFFQAIS
jgi:hypothetical protein